MIEAIGVAILSSALTCAIVGWLGRTWLEARIRNSIEHEYAKQLKTFERDLATRDRIAAVAELLAEYMRIPHGETVSREQRTLLNKLSFSASLWLPPEILLELSKRLQNLPDAKTVFDIIVLARRHLVGDVTIGAQHVTYWHPSLEKSGPPVASI
jgi:hypothetical protein